jgi:hypothetical protein
VKGWTTELAADDPLYLKLKGEAAFKSEPCIVRDPVGDNAPPKPSATDDIALVETLEPKVLGLLRDAGYTTVNEVILASDKLTEITGIGQATADKIVAACEGYLAE